MREVFSNRTSKNNKHVNKNHLFITCCVHELEYVCTLSGIHEGNLEVERKHDVGPEAGGATKTRACWFLSGHQGTALNSNSLSCENLYTMKYKQSLLSGLH